jgi:small subunit ribosomal protein S15
LRESLLLWGISVIVLAMISKTKKQNIIKDVRVHTEDTGSPEVQISLLTRKIEELASHLKKHQKDNHSRRGLLGMVSERQAHMNYLSKKDSKRFNALMKKLNLKKKAV